MFVFFVAPVLVLPRFPSSRITLASPVARGVHVSLSELETMVSVQRRQTLFDVDNLAPSSACSESTKCPNHASSLTTTCCPCVSHQCLLISPPSTPHTVAVAIQTGGVAILAEGVLPLMTGQCSVGAERRFCLHLIYTWSTPDLHVVYT